MNKKSTKPPSRMVLQLGASERGKGVYTEYMTDAERACNNAAESLLKGIKGMGLLDTLLAIMVSAVFLILGIAYYENVTREQKMNETISQIQAITTAASKVVAQGTAQTSITNTNNNLSTAVQKMLPQSTLTSAWNRSALVISQKLSSTPNGCLGFTVEVGGVPLGTQKALASKFMAAFSANSPTQPTLDKQNMTFQLCVE